MCRLSPNVTTSLDWRYLALARDEDTVTTLLFKSEPKLTDATKDLAGCNNKCDDSDQACGSADYYTTDGSKPLTNRVWAVYDLKPGY